MSSSPVPSSSRKPLFKGETPRDDSDGEDNDQDSESEKKSSESESSSSEDEIPSDVDDTELDRWRTECADILADLERQFNQTKDQLFREKLTQVDDKLFDIRSSRGQEYLRPFQQLQENMRIRSEVATVLKQFRINSINKVFEAENQAIQQNLQSEQNLLMDRMKEELENEIRRLEDDRNNIDVSSALCGSDEKKPKKYTARQKQVSVTGPYIVYMLSDEDILSDLTVIKKALAASKRKLSGQ